MKTVLIVGAGGSKDIWPGFGLGHELFQQISDRVTDRTAPNNPYLSYFLMETLGCSYADLNLFVKAMDDYKSAVEYPSIDAFLNEIKTYPEFENLRDKYLEIGRYSIIRHILGWEGEFKDSRKSDFGWMQVVKNYIKNNNLYENQNISNQLDIVTFNYDRLIEFTLLEHGGAVREKINAWISNHVHHIYGSIGKIDSPDHHVSNGLLHFGSPATQADHILKYMENIRLVYDYREHGEHTFQHIHQLVIEANRIGIFGFGFESLNCLNLGLHKLLDGQWIDCNIYPFNDEGFIYRRKLTEKIRTMQPQSKFHYHSCRRFVQDMLGETEHLSKI